MQYPLPIARLIDNYMKLPGIGEKTATRLAFYTMDMPEQDVEDFSKSLMQVKENLHSCSICGNITESDPCEICRDQNRDRSTIMVVEQPKDVMAFEEMGEYNGLYHVLHGVLSPMDGVGPEEIKRWMFEAREMILASFDTKLDINTKSNRSLPCRLLSFQF